MSTGPPLTTAQCIFALTPAEGVVPSIVVYPTKPHDMNLQHEAKQVVIENLRGKEDSVTLDTAGFQLFSSLVKHRDFTDAEEIEKNYYSECIEFLKEVTGALKSKISSSVTVSLGTEVRCHRLDGTLQGAQPAWGAHVDYTSKSAVLPVERFLPAAEVPFLLQRRFQIINIWRPISHPAFDCPLALCDYRSMNPQEDTFSVRREGRGIVEEMLSVKYNENQKWKYFYGMKPDEALSG